MNRISVVIGANYGDEGKGHFTDYLAGPDAMVVRFNGGAQAGHTVKTPAGRRHVFHHFGSGVFRGSPTFLSKHFLVNPMFFREEHELLKDQIPQVIIDPMALVSTPFDMMINQLLEQKRGNMKHGSCGLGINETVIRSATRPVRWEDLDGDYPIEAILEQIRMIWIPRRLAELKIEPSELPFLDNPGIRRAWARDIDYMNKNSRTLMWGQAMKERERIVFEGAQGLMLDEYSPDFPHVTRSRTGLTNVLQILSESGTREQIDVYYVTRPYLTRHGAGPLRNELVGKPYDEIQDRTNIANPHQGSLRFAWLDVDKTAEFIRRDVNSNPIVKAHLGMTCMDQVPESFVVAIDKTTAATQMGPLIWELRKRANLNGFIGFNGETRENLKNI